MHEMKKHICILTLAALAFACTPAANETQEEEIYAGNQAKVTFSSADPIPAEGGSVNVTVSTTLDFSYSLPATAKWLTVSQKDSVLTFTAPANPNATARYAGVALIDKAKDIVFTRFDINQAGTEVQEEIVMKSFVVSPTTLNVEASATSASFDITGEVAWTATSDNSAFTVSPASGSNNGTVTVSFPANTDSEKEVTANITVATTDAGVAIKSFTVAITQAKAPKTGLDPVKPAAGTVLAEWYFCKAQTDVLNVHFQEAVADELADKAGNGGCYVEPNVSGKGRLEYYNGCDKWAAGILDKEHKRCKRAVGSYGEPCVYGTYKDDYILWTAYTETEAPIAAGTKLSLFFALRPNSTGVMKYWLVEYLDGEEWKVAGETKEAADGAKYNVELFYGETQTNTFIEPTVTLTKDTPAATFRITCVSNAQASDGAALTLINKSHALRFAGEDTNEATPQYSVTQHPMIKVVE